MRVMREGYCQQTIHRGAWSRASKCSRKAVSGGYCKQHHPNSVAKRREEQDAVYEEKQKQSPYYKLKQANERIQELELKLATIERETAEKCAEIADDTVEDETQDEERHWIKHYVYGGKSSDAIRNHFKLGE